MMAKIIRKMQVPAYWPDVVGVQADEYRGVEWLLVKTMAIVMMLEDVLELEEEVALDDIPDMSMLPIL
jgi:hypothetical protein